MSGCFRTWWWLLVYPLITPDMSNVAEVTLSKVSLHRPYDKLCLCINHRFLEKNLDF